LNPARKSDKELENQGVINTKIFDLAENLALFLQKYPEFGQLIQTWPEISEPVKRQIIELIGDKAISSLL